MSHESVIRTAAVVAAAALLAAPYWPAVRGLIAQAAEAARQHRDGLLRLAAAGLLIAAAWGQIPMPRLPAIPARPVSVETPTVEMQRLVEPVGAALRSMPMGSRMLWADAWSKVALVAAGDAVTTEVAFTDTRSLRAFTTLAVDIAWRRIGGHQPGSVAGLREAVEAAYGTALGKDVVPVTSDVRARYVEFAKAIAWAGVNGG